MAGEIIQYQTEDGVTVKLGDHPQLAGAGRIQAKVATKKVDAEYDAWHTRAINAPSAVEQHFLEAVSKAKAIEAGRPKLAKGGKS